MQLSERDQILVDLAIDSDLECSEVRKEFFGRLVLLPPLLDSSKVDRDPAIPSLEPGQVPLLIRVEPSIPLSGTWPT